MTRETENKILDRDNIQAQNTYRALGMEGTSYLLFEQMLEGMRSLSC